MLINIQGHGFDLTGPLKDYADKKIGKLDEFFNNIIKADIILDARDIKSAVRSHVAEVSLWVGGKKVIRAAEAGQDMYAAIDLVFEELKIQLKKHKEKHIQEKRRDGEKFKKMTREYNPETEQEEGTGIVKKNKLEVKNMTREEAIEELKLFSQDFLVFRNVETGDINMVQGKRITGPSKLSALEAGQAVKTLKKSRKKVFAFLNSSTNQMNVLYKRNSGNLGLIEPSL